MIDYTKQPARFVMKTEMAIGEGTALTLASLLVDRGWRRAALVVDAGVLAHSEYAKRVVDAASAQLGDAVVIRGEMPEPTYDYLDQVKAAIEGRPLDCVVGIGGGSAMDLSKGLASLATNPGKAIQYRGFGRLVHQPLPVVALPTTAGTGSEVTPYAVFIDTEQRWKFGINSEFNYPRLAVYDPGFLDSCPDSVYASSGMDAMTHTLESFVAKNATPMSRIFSFKAFDLLFASLSKIAAGDRSMETKLDALVGSGCAGIALMNAGAGPAGALSYPLGVYFNVPHGLAGSVFLPHVIEFNAANGYTEYAQLYDRIPGGRPGGSDQDRSVRFAQQIEELSRRLGIPTTLKGFGVRSDADARLIVDNAWQLKLAFEQNPIPFGQPEIERCVLALASAWEKQT